MRILLAAKHPPGGRRPIGGVQSWIATVAAEFRGLGHDVAVWGPEWPLTGKYDFGVLANLAHTERAVASCGRVLKVSHGIIPDEAGDAEFLATSEEVAAHWGCRGVIRQPLDLDFWTPGSGPRTLLVRHSYRGGLTFLPRQARLMGLRYVHLRTLSPEGVREHLQRAAVVVATGRAAVEAMACGAGIVIADEREYQGPLLDPDPVGAMRRNYSGRGGVVPTPGRMREAIESAIGRDLTAHVARCHNVRTVARQLLEYASC